MLIDRNLMTQKRHGPYLAFAFSIEIGQGQVVSCNEISGLVMETNVETLLVGGMNYRELQLAGPSKFPSRLVLKRGLDDIRYLWNWYMEVVEGKIKRRDIAIYLYDEEGIKRRQWHFREACPIKWTGPDLRASTSGIAFESVELVHKGLLL
jgi:phage tail-like protein